jgi:hypothetical protein
MLLVVSDLSFFPALVEHTILVQRDWLKDERLASLPPFDWFYPENVWTECSANLYTECTANAPLLIYVRKYSNWQL